MPPGSPRRLTSTLGMAALLCTLFTHTHSKHTQARTAWPHVGLMKRELKCEGFFKPKMQKKCASQASPTGEVLTKGNTLHSG